MAKRPAKLHPASKPRQAAATAHAAGIVGTLDKKGRFRPLAGPSQWYDAVRDSKRRRSPSILLMSEDRILLPFARRRMVGTGRDLRRNFTDAAWMVRKHLDFVSTFIFHARTANGTFNKFLEKLMGIWSRPGNFDLAGRHSLPRFTRMLEGCAVIDGDCGAALLSDGRVQAIEGDRIRTPGDGMGEYAKEKVVHGVLVNDSGRAMKYAVCKRTPQGVGFTLDRWVSARYMIHHGYFDRFDQVRGITPLATALNQFQDVYEGRTYALAKSKAAQLFGVKFTRQNSDPLDGGGLTNTSDAANPSGVAVPPGPVDYATQMRQANEAGGVPMLDMDPGDDVSFLENRTPSTEFQEFDARIIASALKSLDLPYSFYDESHTNFFGSKGALQQYLFAVDIKRDNLRDNFLDRWTRWRLSLAIATGELTLPRDVSYDELGWEWVPAGLPWWKPLEEVQAQREAVKGGFGSTPRVCKDRGDDAYALADEEAEYRIYRAGLAKKVRAAGGRMPEDEPTSVSEAITTESTALAKEKNGEKANV